MQILLVHSNNKILKNLEVLLDKAGWVLTITENVSSAREFLCMAKVDAFILEDHLPDGEGADILHSQKTASFSTGEFPVVFLHGKDGKNGKNGKNGKWPNQFSTYCGRRQAFRKKDLLLALSRASDAVPPLQLTCGPLVIEMNGEMYLSGKNLNFSQREKRIIISLALNQGQPMSSTRILSDIWGLQHDPNTNIVAVYIKNIRKKLMPYELIKTLRGVGYLMEHRD